MRESSAAPRPDIAGRDAPLPRFLRGPRGVPKPRAGTLWSCAERGSARFFAPDASRGANPLQAGVGIMQPSAAGIQTLSNLLQQGIGVQIFIGSGAQILAALIQLGTGLLPLGFSRADISISDILTNQFAISDRLVYAILAKDVITYKIEASDS